MHKGTQKLTSKESFCYTFGIYALEYQQKKCLMKILVVNGGSSTYKCALYDFNNGDENSPALLWEKLFEFSKEKKKGSPQDLQKLLFSCPGLQNSPIAAIGHRVVHGGRFFCHPCIINSEVKRKIKSCFPFAPLHNPINLQGIEIMQSLFPRVPQVAVFDTAFHRTLSQVAQTYPLPKKWRDYGIRRYGFHGISHEYCVKKGAQIIKKDFSSLKIISCHLGNGSSLAAVSHGQCVDTTMGLTPLEGVMMGTRCGSIDPGILIYLMREHGIKAKELDQGLNYESGIQGIAGISDMRELQRRQAKGKKEAILAFEMYLHSLKKNIGAMIGSLGGMDLLLFTGGIGENSAEVRARVCQHFEFLGVKIDVHKNESPLQDAPISQAGSRVQVLVIHTCEELAIAQACSKLLNFKQRAKNT